MTAAEINTMRNRWENMIQRCTNPRRKEFKHYGGRGITICPRWRASFADYLADVGMCPRKGMSLDRIDNDGNYEPGNVRWATQSEQMLNSRRKPIDIVGQSFGRWQVLALDHTDRFSWWSCRCACGVAKVVRRDKLVTGGSRSCGCLAREGAGHRARDQLRGRRGRWNARAAA